MTDRRLLLVHAHPDDESSQTPATMARYVAEGAQVTLVTCTAGELGEILVPELAHLFPAELGRHRLTELDDAMKVLGMTDYVRLGGDFRYHDTGMEHTEERTARAPDEVDPAAFWRADLLQAADDLVAIIRDRRPQVAITYNTMGGYGHPDHVQANRVTTYAIALAATPTHRPELGPAWQIGRLLWTTWRAESFRSALRAARDAGVEAFGDLDPEGELPPFGAEDADIAAIVEFGPWLGVMRAALAAHRTQVGDDNAFWDFFSLMQTQPGAGEAYLFAGGVPFPESDRPADDIFAGLA